MSRVQSIAIAAFSIFPLCSCSNKGQDEQSKNDLAALQGTWEAVSVESEGKPVQGFAGIKMTFSGNRCTTSGIGEATSTVQLDASQNPRHIDITNN